MELLNIIINFAMKERQSYQLKDMDKAKCLKVMVKLSFKVNLKMIFIKSNLFMIQRIN